MKILGGTLLLAAVFAINGCATLLKGTNEQVMVSSDPSGADVSINGQHAGTTPYVTTVPSSQDLHIEVSKAGYQPASIDDKTNFRWGYEIWSFVEFVIPMGVDLADGAAWGHQQNMVAAHLEQVTPSVAAAQAATPTVLPALAKAPAESPK
jgi:hypothetical protein